MQLAHICDHIYIYWVLTKKVAKKIRLYVAQET